MIADVNTSDPIILVAIILFCIACLIFIVGRFR